MELRTKSLEEAITKHVEYDGGIIVIEYCPGDGTRYELVFTPVRDAISGASDAMVATLINFPKGPSMLVERNGGFLAPMYVEEKLGISGPSAITLAEVIARFTGREALSPEQYRAQFG